MKFFSTAFATSLFLFPLSAADAGLMSLAGIESISFFERSGAAPVAFTFDSDGPEMITRATDPLTASNRDFIGTTFGADENYDVFYSDADGTFNADGDFISVTAVYDFSGDSGLNLAGVRLNFSSSPSVFADTVTSVVALGTSPFPVTASNAVDGDINSHTSMGDTANSTERLRVTVGFSSISDPTVPEPTSLAIFGLIGTLGLIGTAKRKRKK